MPIDLRRLASSDADVRAGALWQLAGSIYHQGDVFDATAAAVPFLVALASNPALPNRADVLGLLAEIAASAAATDPEKIRTGWARREAEWPAAAFARPAAAIAEEQIAAGLAVRAAVEDAMPALRLLAGDADAAVGRAAGEVLEAMSAKRA